jgi:Na+-translocating ferredoxin:NAD+ oxidoreductase RnfD subunit
MEVWKKFFESADWWVFTAATMVGLVVVILDRLAIWLIPEGYANFAMLVVIIVLAYALGVDEKKHPTPE